MNQNMRPPERNPNPEIEGSNARIRAAAQALAEALSAGGGEYEVTVHSIAVSAFDGERWHYDVRVVEHWDRQIAP